MAEQPTDAQKMAAAQAALAAMDPPRTEEDVAPNTLEEIVSVIWSQLALVPQAGAAPALTQPMFCEWLTTDDPALQNEIKVYNDMGVRLAARVHASNVSKP